MSDLISRQAVIDALKKCHKYCIDPFDSYHIDIEDAEARLRDLPSAHSESDWSYDEDEKEITIVVPNDIYESTESIFLTVGYEGELGLRGTMYFAQPERKKGKWIKKMRVIETEKYISYDPDWYCACCGAKYDPHIAKIVNFCYVCGADMRGEQDETN